MWCSIVRWKLSKHYSNTWTTEKSLQPGELFLIIWFKSIILTDNECHWRESITFCCDQHLWSSIMKWGLKKHCTLFHNIALVQLLECLWRKCVENDWRVQTKWLSYQLSGVGEFNRCGEFEVVSRTVLERRQMYVQHNHVHNVVHM